MGNAVATRDKAHDLVECIDPKKADLRAIDQVTALRIVQALGRCSAAGHADVKRLQDIDPPEYRLRVGDFGLRFYVHGDSIQVLALDRRRQAYR